MSGVGCLVYGAFSSANNGNKTVSVINYMFKGHVSSFVLSFLLQHPGCSFLSDQSSPLIILYACLEEQQVISVSRYYFFTAKKDIFRILHAIPGAILSHFRNEPPSGRLQPL